MFCNFLPSFQEVPFPIFPRSLGASSQPDRDGGVQLRYGRVKIIAIIIAIINATVIIVIIIILVVVMVIITFVNRLTRARPISPRKS